MGTRQVFRNQGRAFALFLFSFYKPPEDVGGVHYVIPTLPITFGFSLVIW